MLPLVEGPFWKLTMLSCCLMCWSPLSIFVLCGRNYFGPMCQGVVDTLSGSDVVVAVPM